MRALVLLVLALIGAWIVLSVIGLIVKGLFWLAVVGLLFAAGSVALGAAKRR